MTGAPNRVVGRYAIYDTTIGRGGMGAVHFGRLFGDGGFARTVAIKMLRPEIARDAGSLAMFLDESRLASRISHPNVVQTIDLVSTQAEAFAVMEYVHGESLSKLMREARARGERIPLPIALSIACGVLSGLHGAHEAKGTSGEPLRIVHRDVSPENVLVGADGVAKIADFGIAWAEHRVQAATRTGEVKGKAAYMAPEQFRGGAVGREADIFAAGIVLWEMLAGRRLFEGNDRLEVLRAVLALDIEPLRAHAPDVPEPVERAVMRALEREPQARFSTALEMAMELQRAVAPASAIDVGEWVRTTAARALEMREAQLAVIESPDGGVGVEEEEDEDEEPETGEPTRAVPGLALEAPRRMTARWTIGIGIVVAALVGVVYLGARMMSPTAPLPDLAGESREGTDRAGHGEVHSESVVERAAEEMGPPSTSSPPAAASVRAKSKVRSRKAPECSPPYTIGSDGLRHYKPECW